MISATKGLEELQAIAELLPQAVDAGISKREIERLTGRRVTAFMSANQTAPGVACELFFLEAPPAESGPMA